MARQNENCFDTLIVAILRENMHVNYTIFLGKNVFENSIMKKFIYAF